MFVHTTQVFMNPIILDVIVSYISEFLNVCTYNTSVHESDNRLIQTNNSILIQILLFR